MTYRNAISLLLLSRLYRLTFSLSEKNQNMTTFFDKELNQAISKTFNRNGYRSHLSPLAAHPCNWNRFSEFAPSLLTLSLSRSRQFVFYSVPFFVTSNGNNPYWHSGAALTFNPYKIQMKSNYQYHIKYMSWRWNSHWDPNRTKINLIACLCIMESHFVSFVSFCLCLRVPNRSLVQMY